MSENEIQSIPFGKHKGKDLLDVAKDRNYVEWLLAQPWIKQTYPIIYNNLVAIIVNGGPVQNHIECTPDHNKLQAKFLDMETCKPIVKLACEVEFKIENVNFEVPFANQFADVVISYSRFSYIEKFVETGDSESSPPHEVKHMRKMSEYTWDSYKFSRYENKIHKYFSVRELIEKEGLPIKSKSWWDTHYAVIELKPIVGDDYPAILRKAISLSKAVERHEQKFEIMVLTEKYEGSVDFENVKKIFKTNGIIFDLIK